MKSQNFLLLFLAFFTISCSSIKTYDTSTPEGAYNQAEEYAKYERFEEAIERFKNVKAKFPYSSFAKKSDLRVADINFERESYVEAQSSYQLYKDLYPADENIDYVTFRIGISYFNQLPNTVERDLSVAEKAIRSFDELEKVYPNSKYAQEAKDKRAKAVQMLAEKELEIAKFYLKKEKYLSALGRYEDLIKKYPNSGLNREALYGAALSAHKSDSPIRAKMYATELIKLFADSNEAHKIQKELNLWLL